MDPLDQPSFRRSTTVVYTSTARTSSHDRLATFYLSDAPFLRLPYTVHSAKLESCPHFPTTTTASMATRTPSRRHGSRWTSTVSLARSTTTRSCKSSATSPPSNANSPISRRYVRFAAAYSPLTCPLARTDQLRVQHHGPLLERRHHLQHANARRGACIRDVVLGPRFVHVSHARYVPLAPPFSCGRRPRACPSTNKTAVHHAGASIAEIVSAFPTCGGL